MRWILMLLLMPVLGFSQNGKSYFSINSSLNFTNSSETALGAHLTGNGQISQAVFLGIGTGVVTFRDYAGVYVPLQGVLTVMPGKELGRVSPLLVFESGYGAYNRTVRTTNLIIKTVGGFTYHAGMGATFRSKRKSSGMLTVGYSKFGFKTNDIKSKVQSVTLKVGLMLQ